MTSKTNAAASGTVSRFGAKYDALGLSVLRTELSSGDGMEMVGVETDDNPLAPQAGLLQDASGGHGLMSTPLESPLQSPLLPSTSFTERDARFEGATPGAPDQKLVEESFAFLYDGIGNRLTAQKGNDTTAYTPNALNQYTDIDGIEPVYDADGNLFSDGKNRFHWDAENRLTLVEPLVPTEGSKRLEFKYDYIGRRVSKQVWTRTGGSWTDESTTAFVYDGWNLIEEVSTSSHTASINHYTWGLDLSGSLQGAGGVGGLLSVVCAPFSESGLIGDWLLPIGYVSLAPSTFHYTFDLNGNVSELLDSTGSIAAHYEYGPFGELTHEFISSNSHLSLLTFNFSTKYYDRETGLLYYGFRYYDPQTGRWLSRDPIGESGGISVYGMVGNDTVNVLDYLGLFPPSGSSYWQGLALRGQAEQAARNNPAAYVPSWAKTPAAEVALGVPSGAGKNAIIGVGVIIVVGAVATLSAPVAITATGAILLAGAVTSVSNRYVAGQSPGQIAAGLPFDMTGVTGIYAGVANKDIITQQDLGLSNFERGEAAGGGCVNVILLVKGPAIGRQSFAKTNQIRGGWSSNPLLVKTGLALPPWEPGVPSVTTGAGSVLNLVDETAFKATPGYPNPRYPDSIGGTFTTEATSTSYQAQSLSALNYRPLGYLRADGVSGSYRSFTTEPQVGQIGGLIEFTTKGVSPIPNANFQTYTDVNLQMLLNSILGQCCIQPEGGGKD